MISPQSIRNEDAELERRVAIRVFIGSAAFLLAVGILNAATLLTEAEREGIALDPRMPIVLEMSSVLAILLLVPLLVWFERRMPFSPETWGRALLWHGLGTVVFSLLHVTLFSLFRATLFPPLFGEAYVFATNLPVDLLYEYRKDLLPYAVIVLLLGLQRQLEEHKREAQALRAEARRTGRVTLKSGGRTLIIDAGRVEWAAAAGNYVEIHGVGETQLARISLSGLAALLIEAGADMVRVHRSHLVNRDKVREIIPSGDGDFRVKLAGGAEVRGSRRFREAIA